MAPTSPKEKRRQAGAPAHGAYSRRTLIEKKSAREEKNKQLKQAVEYARGHGLGGCATKSTGLFPLVSAQQIHNALQGKVKLLSDSARHAQAVLTSAERSVLATWVEACAINKNAAKDEHVSAQVVLMLKARRIDNRQRKHGRGTVPLTERETRPSRAQHRTYDRCPVARVRLPKHFGTGTRDGISML